MPPSSDRAARNTGILSAHAAGATIPEIAAALELDPALVARVIRDAARAEYNGHPRSVRAPDGLGSAPVKSSGRLSGIADERTVTAEGKEGLPGRDVERLRRRDASRKRVYGRSGDERARRYT